VWNFLVSVGESKHKVSVSEEYWNDLTDGDVSPSELVEKSFQFLLAREPVESILPSFDLTQIKQHFPEYEENLRTL
jgi:hypothetical protein